MQANTEVPQQKKGLLYTIASLSAIVGIIVLIVTWDSQKFWTFDYQLFLATMFLIPPALVHTKSRYLRVVFILFALGYFGFLQSACPRPVGAIELIFLHLLDENPILMHVIKVGVLILVTIIFARFYCGWICPKGIIQDMVYYKRLRFRMPPKIDHILKYGKYVTLMLLIAAPIIWHYRLFREIGPFKVLFNLDGSTYLIIFFAFVLLVSVFVQRAYCRYFCPVGGLLAIISMISPMKMRTTQSQCISCMMCQKVCPVDAISVERKVPATIDAKECILCKECESVCVKNAIYFGFKPKNEQTKGVEQ